MPAELKHGRKWFSPSRKPGSIQLLLWVRHSQLTLRSAAQEKSHGDSLGYSPPGDRDICKEEHEKKKKTSRKIRMRIILAVYSSQARLVGDPHLCSSLPHLPRTPALLWSHPWLTPGFFLLLLKYYVGSFGQELFDPGTTFTPEYIARGRGADPSFLGCLGSIIRLARLEQLKMNWQMQTTPCLSPVPQSCLLTDVGLNPPASESPWYITGRAGTRHSFSVKLWNTGAPAP